MTIRFEPLSPRTNAILGALVSGGDWLTLAKALCEQSTLERIRRKEAMDAERKAFAYGAD